MPTIGWVSKTEHALDSDGAALDELDEFVAAEAAAADRAIGELIDDAVEPGNGHRPSGTVGHDVDDVIAANGFDTAEIELGDETDSGLDTSELDIAADELDAFDTSDLERPAGDVLDEVAEVESDTFELVHLEALIETDDGIVDDEAVEQVEDVDAAEQVEEVEAAEDVEEAEAAEDVEEAEAAEEVEEAEALSDAEAPYELPEIVPATDDDDDDDAGQVARHGVLAAPVGLAAPVARTGDLDEVSDDILEELRRADIDGPIVEFAPQDDTTSARRRPKRQPDYDPAPVPIPARPPRILGRKPRVRKVTRVVRHVDPWSVFKIAAVAFMVMYVIALTAGVLLWNVAYATGTVDNVERFFESFGWSSFEFNGGEIYHASWIMGLFAVIGLTGGAVLAATLFNLITDIVGGMRFTVLEEEVVETRTSPMRRFVIRRPEPEVPAVIHDSSGAMIREAVVDDSGAIER